MPCLGRRILWLVAIYAILAAAPVAAAFVPLNTVTISLMWLAFAPLIAGVMVLTLWSGLGNSRVLARIAGLLGGVAYLSVWPTIMSGLQLGRLGREFKPLEAYEMYVEILTPYFAIGVVLSGVFAVTRRWYQFCTLAKIAVAHGTPRLQFSVFHLLVLMSLVAIVLSLTRGARGTGNIEEGFEPGIWAAVALGGVTLFANTACAAYAALGVSSVRRNCMLVLLVSVLLGIAFAYSARQEQLGPVTFVGGTLAMASPTALLLVSLLWLRPCGLRLVRRVSCERQHPSTI